MAYVILKTILRNSNYFQCFNIAPAEKAWFMAPMKYSPSGKGVIAPREYTSMVYSPYGKGNDIFYHDDYHFEKSFFERVIVMIKDKGNTV